MKTVKIRNIRTGAINIAQIDEEADLAIMSIPNDYKVKGLCAGNIMGRTLSGLLKEWEIIEELPEEES